MFDWTFLHVERVHLAGLALLVVGALFVLELRSRSALSAFLSPVMQRRLTAQASRTRAIVKLALVIAPVAGVQLEPEFVEAYNFPPTTAQTLVAWSKRACMPVGCPLLPDGFVT